MLQFLEFSPSRSGTNERCLRADITESLIGKFVSSHENMVLGREGCFRERWKVPKVTSKADFSSGQCPKKEIEIRKEKLSLSQDSEGRLTSRALEVVLPELNRSSF